MNTQRIVVCGAAVLGALTPVLPWRQLGMLTVPLTHDVEFAALVSVLFFAAAVFALVGDKSKPVRSSRGRAAVLTLIGLAILALVTLIWSLLPPQVDLGMGAIAAWGFGAVVTFVTWMDFS